MKPQTPDSALQDDLVRYRLDNIISLQHPLARLAERIDWEGMSNLLDEYYEEAVVRQPPKPTRLMAGLLYLQQTFALSNEELIARRVENSPIVYSRSSRRTSCLLGYCQLGLGCQFSL